MNRNNIRQNSATTPLRLIKSTKKSLRLKNKKKKFQRTLTPTKRQVTIKAKVSKLQFNRQIAAIKNTTPRILQLTLKGPFLKFFGGKKASDRVSRDRVVFVAGWLRRAVLSTTVRIPISNYRSAGKLDAEKPWPSTKKKQPDPIIDSFSITQPASVIIIIRTI